MNTTTTDNTREALAAYSHDESWSGMMRYLFKQGTTHDDGSFTIRPWAVERWTRQMQTPYAELPEQEKLSDRAEADRILAILANSSAAPTAALPAAGPVETSPAEAGRQRYTERSQKPARRARVKGK